MAKIDATALAGISFANSTEEGDAVVFGFKDHLGQEHKFACPPDAIPMIVARLLGAAQQSATIRQHSEVGIVANKSQIVVMQKARTVGLVLFPTEKTGISFVLSPQHAQKISSDLAHAASIVDPQQPQKAN